MNASLEHTHAKQRRLAVIDTTFPWLLSGFRYWENMEILKQRPDTLFFATDPQDEEFPAEVHHISEFSRMAEEAGITDVYCVFLNLALSLIGQTTIDGIRMPGTSGAWNIRPVLDRLGIRLHTTIYPGGGFMPSTSPAFLRAIDEQAATVFTNTREVLTQIPRSLYIPGVIHTETYEWVQRPEREQIHLAFCAFNHPRKGFPQLVQAFNRLDDSFFLHLVGNWQDELYRITNPNFTFHDYLGPDELKSIYQQADVFVSCSTADLEALDGFPTTAACEAMSSGCLLVTTNVRNDRYILRSGIDYVEIEPEDPDSLFKALMQLRARPEQLREIAANGARQMREQYDAAAMVRKKLAAIFG